MLNQSGIYEILNTVNGKRYIGQSQNMKKRWTAHRWHLRTGQHHAAPLQNAWNKYGEGAFKFRVILTCAVSMLDFYEQQLLDKAAPEYNICPIAESTRGVKRPPEFGAAISARMMGNTILLGKKLPPEWAEAIAAANRGKKRSPEACLAMSKAHIGEIRSQESREKQSKKMKGKPKSPTHCANISKGRKGKTFGPQTPEHIAARVAGWKKAKAARLVVEGNASGH